MNCPACSNPLNHLTEREFELDVCRAGCGGVWFDRGELEKFDHPVEVSSTLLRLRLNKQVAVDMAKTRYCPKCPNQPLRRFRHDAQPELELDDCTQCGGIWLDLGEVALFRESNAEGKARERVHDDFVRQYEAANKGAIPAGVKAVLGLIFR